MKHRDRVYERASLWAPFLTFRVSGKSGLCSTVHKAQWECKIFRFQP
jgi:hypothetical protein